MLGKLDSSIWVGSIQAGFSLMNPNPSHEARFRLELEDEMLEVGVKDDPAKNAGGGPSSLNSTSPTNASYILIIPAFFSNNTNRLSWLEYRTLAVVEDVLR